MFDWFYVRFYCECEELYIAQIYLADLIANFLISEFAVLVFNSPELFFIYFYACEFLLF